MKLGNWGEDIAEKYLKNKGYLIIERNFRCRLGEIDIIAMDGAELVFIEVKTRQNQSYGLPCEAINAVKVRHIKRTAAYYAAIHAADDQDSRLDVIEILTKEGQAYLHHIENITG
ncbi:MAG: YraN family protein [Eubacteriales bacterium]|nr:YraN family protein [Eubacteriales bacterium]